MCKIPRTSRRAELYFGKGLGHRDSTQIRLLLCMQPIPICFLTFHMVFETPSNHALLWSTEPVISLSTTECGPLRATKKRWEKIKFLKEMDPPLLWLALIGGGSEKKLIFKPQSFMFTCQIIFSLYVTKLSFLFEGAFFFTNHWVFKNTKYFYNNWIKSSPE